MKIGEWNVFTTVTGIIKKYYNGRDIVVIGDNLDFAAFIEENGLKISHLYTITEEEDEAKADEAKADEAKADEAKADEAKADEAKADEVKADEAKAAEVKADKAKADGAAEDGSLEEKEFDPLDFIRDDDLKAAEGYVLFTELTRSNELCDVLAELGYIEFQDYVFANHGRIVVRAGTEEYTDEYGNEVHCKNCKVFINDFCCNVHINVDETALFGGKCYISARHTGAGEVTIGPDCRFIDNVSMVIAGDAKIRIGAGTKIVQNSGIVALEGTTVEIGEKCLFSYDVKIYCGDGHAIFDSVSRERLNFPVDHPKNVIRIGNYVWVGMRAVVMNRCEIGDGSIVGAASVVKGRYPNNCAIGGNPARLIRKNVIWDNNYTDGMLEECPEEYILPTMDPE